MGDKGCFIFIVQKAPRGFVAGPHAGRTIGQAVELHGNGHARCRRFHLFQLALPGQFPLILTSGLVEGVAAAPAGAVGHVAEERFCLAIVRALHTVGSSLT
jgi:hypothetical protein